MKTTMNIISNYKCKVHVICAFIPFVLFWAGVFSPLWTENFVVYVLALAPYYLYTFYLSNDWIDGKKLYDTRAGEYASKIWVLNIAVAALSSLFFAIVFCGFKESVFYGPALITLVNAGFNFAWALWAAFLHKTRYARWPIMFAPPVNGS